MANLLDEAEELGSWVAHQHNKEMNTGVTGSREMAEITNAYERLKVIVGILGEPAREAFAKGYDETIDFSLNPDRRKTETSDYSDFLDLFG